MKEQIAPTPSFEQTCRKLQQPHRIASFCDAYYTHQFPLLDSQLIRTAISHAIIQFEQVCVTSKDRGGEDSRVFSDASFAQQAMSVGRMLQLAQPDIHQTASLFSQNRANLPEFIDTISAANTALFDTRSQALDIQPLRNLDLPFPDILNNPGFTNPDFLSQEDKQLCTQILEIENTGKAAGISFITHFPETAWFPRIHDSHMPGNNTSKHNFVRGLASDITLSRLDELQHLALPAGQVIGIALLSLADAQRLEMDITYNLHDKADRKLLAPRFQERAKMIEKIVRAQFDSEILPHSATTQELQKIIQEELTRDSLRLLPSHIDTQDTLPDVSPEFPTTLSLHEGLHAHYHKSQGEAELTRPVVMFAQEILSMAKGDILPNVIERLFQNQLAFEVSDTFKRAAKDSTEEDALDAAVWDVRESNYPLVISIARYLFEKILTENREHLRLPEQSTGSVSDWDMYYFASRNFEDSFTNAFYIVNKIQKITD